VKFVFDVLKRVFSLITMY